MRHSSANALYRAHRASIVAARRGFSAARRRDEASTDPVIAINLVAFGAIAAILLAGLATVA